MGDFEINSRKSSTFEVAVNRLACQTLAPDLASRYYPEMRPGHSSGTHSISKPRRHRVKALDAETAETIVTNASSKEIEDQRRRYRKTHASGNPADDGPILGSTIR